MKLILLQLRIEWRRSRMLLGIYLLLVFCNFTVAVGWIGQPVLSDHGHNSSWTQSPLPSLFIIGLWALFVRLVAHVVMADSPATRDRFLATRPMPRRALYAAKALFIVLAGILPAVVLEILSLRIVHAPASFIAAGALEQFGLLVIAAAFVALFTAHWKSSAAGLIAAAVSFGVGAATIGMLNLVSFFLRNGNPLRIPDPTLFTTALGLLVVSGGLLITATMNARRPWKIRHLAPAFFVFFLLGAAVAIWLPVRYLPIRSAGPINRGQSLDAAFGEVTFANPKFRYSGMTDSRSGRKIQHASYQVRPQWTDAPSDLEIRWRPRETSWLKGHRVLRHDDGRHHAWDGVTITEPGHWLSSALMACIREQCPDVRFLVGDNRSSNRDSAMQIGSICYPVADTPTGPVTLDSEIVATAVRWKLAAKFPIGGASPNSDGQWRFAGTRSGGNDLAVFVSVATHGLQTTAPSLRRRWDQELFFALHVPSLHMIQTGESSRAQPIPSMSSGKHVFTRVRFSDWRNTLRHLTPDELRDAELLVFRSSKVSARTHSFQSAPFTLSTEAVNHHADHGSPEPTSPAAFAHWLRQHADLPVTVSQDVLRKHLTQVLEEADRSHGYLEHPQSPAVRHLARFVPGHLDLFLEVLNDPGLRERRIVTHAITQGARPDQKPAIIAALPGNGLLLDVITARGWLRDAQAALVQLAETSSPPRELPPALLTLDDPALDRTVLDLYRSQPSVALYNTLRSTPRLKERAEELTHAMWAPGLIVLSSNDVPSALSLAMAQGRQEALVQFRERLTLLSAHGSGRYRCGDLISKSFTLPEDLWPKRHDEDLLIKWFLGHEPDEFRFDPVLRRFALLPDQSI